ncbi:MAG: hypothetical protein HY791_00700 [Deltaproteobacteria bacterium]|nr:hypothetical protein [Deltaproteobacteria bacterium]
MSELDDSYARAKALLASAMIARERAQKQLGVAETRLEELRRHEEIARIHQDHELIAEIASLRREVEEMLVETRANLAEASAAEADVKRALDQIRTLARESGLAAELGILAQAPEPDASDVALSNVRDSIRGLDVQANLGSGVWPKTDEAGKPNWEDPKVVLARLKAERTAASGGGSDDPAEVGSTEKKPLKKRTL